MTRIVIVIVLAAIVVFAIAGTAFAASPQDIYTDYSAHGKLTQTYSTADLKAYLADATVHQYGTPSVVAGLDALVKDVLGDRGVFPFTGFEMILGIGAAFVLVAGGLTLRRFGRASRAG